MLKLLAALRIKPTEKVLTIIMIVLLVLTILGGAAAIYLLHSNVNSKNKELEDSKAKVKEAEDKVAKIPAIDSTIEELKPKVEKLVKSIPKFNFMNEYDDLSVLLERLANEAGVEISSNKFEIYETGKGGDKDIKLPPDINEVECEIKVGGTFFGLLKFMSLIENCNRFVVMQDIKSIKGETSGKHEFEETWILKTFTYKGPPLPQPKAIPTAGKTTPLPE